MVGRSAKVVASAQIDGMRGHMEWLHPLLAGMFIR